MCGRWRAWERPSCWPVRARSNQAPHGAPDAVADAKPQPEAVLEPEPGWSAHSRVGWSVCPGQSERSPVSAELRWGGLCLGWGLGSPTQCPSSTGTVNSGPEGPEHRSVRWGLSERQGPGEATGHGVGGRGRKPLISEQARCEHTSQSRVYSPGVKALGSGLVEPSDVASGGGCPRGQVAGGHAHPACTPQLLRAGAETRAGSQTLCQVCCLPRSSRRASSPAVDSQSSPWALGRGAWSHHPMSPFTQLPPGCWAWPLRRSPMWAGRGPALASPGLQLLASPWLSCLHPDRKPWVCGSSASVFMDSAPVSLHLQPRIRVLDGQAASELTLQPLF